MDWGNRCEACGRRNPINASGPGPGVSPVHGWSEPEGVKPFVYLPSRLCVGCRHATTLPGQLAPHKLRTV